MTRRSLLRALLAAIATVPLLGTTACEKGQWDPDRGVMVFHSRSGGGGRN
jgi:hypothetical protein